MTDIEQTQRPVLATVPNVELMHVGTWNISTGQATFTSNDLRAAVAAMDCPAVRRPVLKLGHVDARFDGEPAVGWVANMNTDGSTLWGDYTGMPRWLADVAASAYPDRSIEGWYDFQCQIGHTHPFVLTGVALLGVTAPGIGTLTSLQDVASLYGVAAAQTSKTDTGRSVTITTSSRKAAAMPNPTPMRVAASATVEDVRRAYYEDAPWSVWIEEIQLDPMLQIIVCDDEDGERSRVPVTVDSAKDGEDAISFGTPVPVVIRYEDVPNEDAAEGVAASAAAPKRVTYASRAESRPKASTQPPATEPVESTNPNPTKETTMVDTIATGGILTRLGLAADADLDEAGVLAALDEALAERANPAAETAASTNQAPALPEGQVVISQNVLDELRISAAAGAEARARQLRDDRDSAIAAAVKSGKISPARREHWAAAWDKDPEGTAKDLAELPENRLIPMAGSGYTGGQDDPDEGSVVYNSLFGDDTKKEG